MATFLFQMFLVLVSVANSDAFLGNNPCYEADHQCQMMYNHYKMFDALIPPWDTDDMDLNRVCRESYHTQRCLHRVLFDEHCPIQLSISHLSKMEAQFRFLCADYDTPHLSPYTAKALLESECVTDPLVAFNMRIGLMECKEAFDENRYHEDHREDRRCLLNQEADACVINAVRYHCADQLFRNYFESVWFEQVYHATNSSQRDGSCGARNEQLFYLFLTLRIV